MTSGDGHEPDDDLLERFKQTISGLELDELRTLAGALMSLGHDDALERLGEGDAAQRGASRRRTPMEQPVTYRVRVDLSDAKPPIWRRLDLRSDLTLDRVHDAIQAAMGWTDSHLHRFALGGGVFDRHAEHFLCPLDVEEADEGVPEEDVRLDECLTQPGDVLHYVYDYGDDWEHRLRLEKVLPLHDGQGWARVVDGRRACPPEDCGGLRTADELADVLDEPSHFDVGAANQRLVDPLRGLAELGIAAAVVSLLTDLRGTAIGDELVARLSMAAMTPAQHLEPDEKAAALHAITWMLDHVGDDGLPLTGAGYLKPADVEAVAGVLPSASDWIGKLNREVQTAPVLDSRQSLMRLGLLRKHKGRLTLTAVGRRARQDPALLWTHLAQRLVPPLRESFDTHAVIVSLALIASADHASATRVTEPDVLRALGWNLEPGFRGEMQVSWAARPALAVLYDIVSGPRPDRGRRRDLSVAATALVQEAVLSRSPEST